MIISHLRTNHLNEPLGIDTIPEFSWRIESKTSNLLQTAYQVVVRLGEAIVWDSGVVPSRKQSIILYRGKPLVSRSIYTWEVLVWSNLDKQASAKSSFETGLLEAADWTATWVESTIKRNPTQLFTYGIENPAIIFSKRFVIKKSIKKARLYATAYGIYKVKINNNMPDEREFAPEYTPYDKILNYQCYDVGSMLVDGENTMTFLVGDGWYFCEQTAPITSRVHEAQAVIFQLDVEYADNTKDIIISDGSETCAKSKILFSDLFMGELQDLTAAEQKHEKVITKDYDLSILRAQPLPPVGVAEMIPAVRTFISPKGENIVDFGQVISGRARIKIHEPKGRTISFEYTEVLDKDDNYFSAMTAKQKDILITDGNPIVYEAQFTFHGFRYIRVTGMEKVDAGDFTAVLLTTKKENTSTFVCSDENINRLYKNIRYSQQNNMMSIPTDCPSREKAGWTGDILIYAKTAIINEEMTPFLSSWLEGLMADQNEEGVVPVISPYAKIYDLEARKIAKAHGDEGIAGIAGWGDAIVWVPYQMYKSTGNTLILGKCYESMKKWCDYIIRTAEEKRGGSLPYEIDRYLWNTGFHFGEWLVPGRTGEGFDVCKETASYTAPFFGYQTIKYLSEIALILDKPEEARYYQDIAHKMHDAIEKGIFDTDSMPKDYMGAYVLAFAFDLVGENHHVEFRERLIRLVEANDRRLGTGFLATPFLLDSLEKIGRKDLAKAILWQTEQPSWLNAIRRGATTIWENWIAYDEDNNPLKTSFDHYAFGCVDDWLFRRIGGIDSKGIGFSEIVIAPATDMGFSWCKRTFISEAGEISVDWTKDELKVRIPPNTTATVHWRNQIIEIGSGYYHIR